MATIGLDCQLILDGTGYFIEPDSYHMVRSRVRASTANVLAANPVTHFGVGERYVDQGPGKRVWSFAVLAWQAIDTYAGQRVVTTGQQYRGALHASYEKVATPLTFTDPNGLSWSVHFDHLEEIIDDVRAQTDTALQYTMSVELVEA
ncbi:MAG: hypothetical protein ACR2JC_06420 [Chloroflexota bacterium]